MEADEENGSDEPFLYEPDVKDDNQKNGLMCFIQERECGPACMAFLGFGQVEHPERSVLTKQQSHCMLLVSTERLVKYSGSIARGIFEGLEASRKADADRKRSDEKPPTGPLGTPTPNQRG